MIFTKEELSFIGIYAKCSDTKRPEHDRFRIKTDKEKQEVIFSQFSEGVTLITTLKKPVEENMEVFFPVNQFLPFINSIPVNSEIDIKTDGVHFNGNRYEFETIELSSIFNGTDKFKELVTDKSNVVSISDFGLIKNSFTGPEGFDCTLLVEGNFVSAPNDNTIVCSYKTTNDKLVSFYIPKLAGIIGLENKSDKLDFYKMVFGDDEYWFIEIGNTTLIFNKKDYMLPNIFDDETKNQYDHKAKIEIDKSVFKDVLNRIKVFAARNVHTRIVCSTTNNQFIIESKEPNSGYAIEKVEASIDDALKDQEKLFFIPQTSISTAVNYLKGDNVIIHSNPYSPDEVAVKITDEIGEDFFIVCLLGEN